MLRFFYVLICTIYVLFEVFSSQHLVNQLKILRDFKCLYLFLKLLIKKESIYYIFFNFMKKINRSENSFYPEIITDK
jgi:hypothetical protein